MEWRVTSGADCQLHFVDSSARATYTSVEPIELGFQPPKRAAQIPDRLLRPFRIRDFAEWETPAAVGKAAICSLRLERFRLNLFYPPNFEF
jgi:hypothetical protein